jgi:hypothetical protein
MAKKDDDSCAKGHDYLNNGHVSRCQNKGCNATRTYDPATRSWKEVK